MHLNKAHRVRRISIKSRVAVSTQAFALRTLLHKNIAALEAVLDEACDSLPLEHADMFYRLPNLHVDVSVNENHLLNRELLFGVIKAQVLSAIKKTGDVPKPIQASTLLAGIGQASNALGYQEHYAIGQNELKTKQHEATSILTDSTIDCLLYYLSNGIVPWYAMPNEPLTEARRLLRDKPSLVMLINQQVTDFPARQRWIAFLLNTFGTPSSVMRNLLNATLCTNVKMNRDICEEVLSSPLNMQCKLNILTLFTSLNNDRLPFGLIDDLKNQITAQSQIVEDDASLLAIARSLIAIIESVHDKIKNYSEDIPIAVEQQALAQQQPDLPVIENAIKENFDKDARPIRLNYAGLVLFHPYLPRLFTRQQWLNAEYQIKPECLPIAARSLCYLCAGTTILADDQASIIKLLLGVNIEDLLLVGKRPLSNEVIEELENLTTSFITHWGALGSTSNQALRSSFIKRGGLLTFTDNSWRLTIERQAPDVLLGSLPFSLSTIKLPWMHFPLHLTW